MAKLTGNIPLDPDWLAADRLRLLRGDEEALNLAASAGGGTQLLEEQVFPGVAGPGFGQAAIEDVISGGGGVPTSDPFAALFAGGAAPDRVMEATYYPTDKTAVIPVGVRAVDTHGNVSDPFETFERLNDAPRGVHESSAAATESTGEALLTFTASEDVD